MNCKNCGFDLTEVPLRHGKSKKTGKPWKAKFCPECNDPTFLTTNGNGSHHNNEKKGDDPVKEPRQDRAEIFVLNDILVELKKINDVLSQIFRSS